MAELIKREGNQVSFKVMVPANEVNRAYDQVWTGLAKEVRVPGFRAGKAPRSVLEKRVGTDYVRRQVGQRLIDQNLDAAAQKLDLLLVGIDIEYSNEVVSGKDWEFVVNGETYPTVKLSEWRTATLDVEDVVITDEIVERTLSDIREGNAKYDDVERPIEDTDQVFILEDDAENAYPVHMGVISKESGLFKGLLGKNKGETVEVIEENHDTPIQVKILEVKSKSLPELDDEFAKKLNADNLDTLRKNVRENLEIRAKNETQDARRNALVNLLIEGMDADIPNSMISSRRESMLVDIQNDLKRQGVAWSEYEVFMKEQERLDQFMDNLTTNAKERVCRDLVLDQLVDDLKVEISDMEFGQVLGALAAQNGTDVQSFVDNLGKDNVREYYFSIRRERALEKALGVLFPETPSAEDAAKEAKTDDAAAETTETEKVETTETTAEATPQQ